MARHPTRADIDLLDGSFYVDDPHEKYTWMRENAPVYFDEKNGVWGIASYDALLAMEKDASTFSNAGGIRPDSGPIPMMIDMDDPEHWKRRKLVNKGFTPRRVRDSEETIREVCDAIIDTPLLGTLPDDARQQLAQSVLFPKRLGTPDDYASLAFEIVQNHYLNGEVIRMDAGIRMPPK